MELTSRVIHDVIHPTAAFAKGLRPENPSAQTTAALGSPPVAWQDSQLNPKNRIDSLGLLANPLWRIDGCTGLGTQFYAVPLFLDSLPPMRFDVFIPEEAASCPILRELLDLDAAFHTKDGSRVNHLGISRHILRALQYWTTSSGISGLDSVSLMYSTLPFGSRIVFKNLELDVRSISVAVAPMHNLERQLLSLSRLAVVLGLPETALPEAIDITRLQLIQQLHDSVCLVDIDTEHERTGPWILKALTSASKYIYHELKNLLNMPPHRHVISRPKYLVTKHCKFGGKTAVVGFVLPYYSGGSLRDSLPLLRIQGRISLAQQLKWAVQLSTAVLHVREQGKIFYPDLRLDNVVLTDSGDIVMVDFEQRGVWSEFASPEVNAIEYIRILANANPLTSSEEEEEEEEEEEGGGGGGGEGEPDEPGIPEETRRRYADMLSRYLPGWEALEAREEYTPPASALGYEGYNIPWLCLDRDEQEAAEAYMLGRVLWCLFEGQSAPQPGAVWQSYRREPEIEFPAFQRTPHRLRPLIDRCTRGRRPALSGLITRRGSKIVLRSVAPGMPQDQEQIREMARQWWTEEVRVAEEFLRMREERKGRGEWDGNYFGRPKLKEVLAELEAFRSENGIYE
ncbi:Ribosomal protein S6 kinase alpha-5 [Coniochaeta hoffmannii]|uniref:Ribosomal protein S6 kinase alpha-5 n=1 Tax=Coniochaeta hoffmannii TaxID=91930 RepID=A0AA38VQP5_9PEZI|nr:Ribosomal protein S6 kinase alpha-5 [Coniochaeta hoffmannii]